MIKASAGKFVILGLSHQNLLLLRAGHPMDLDLNELGFDLRVIIFAGETEAKMKDSLSELIGPMTQIHDHQRKETGQ